jgi:hypothetical protein
MPQFRAVVPWFNIPSLLLGEGIGLPMASQNGNEHSHG